MIIAANFKMHLTPHKLATFAATLRDSLDSRLQILLFPNTACLASLPQCHVRWGAQNAYPAQNGAFSGEIGAEVLDALQIQTLLVGHSERRALGESQDFCAQKCRFYAELGFTLVYCIGAQVGKNRCAHFWIRNCTLFRWIIPTSSSPMSRFGQSAHKLRAWSKSPRHMLTSKRYARRAVQPCRCSMAGA